MLAEKNSAVLCKFLGLTFLMKQLIIFLVLLLLFDLFCVEAQSNLAEQSGTIQDPNSNFQPSLAVVIGILCIMFSLTFILLIYAKFCHRESAQTALENQNGVIRSVSRRFSGIDKTVIESLPFFRFSALKGSKEGLECVVCLSKFEDIEILRLLPKCKHAFHINCVDQWLEKHSSCPLCRCRFSADDPEIFTYSNSMRYLRIPSELQDQDDSNIELFVQREENHQLGGSSRFSVGSSFRKLGKANIKEEETLIQEEIRGEDGGGDQKLFNKFNHQIILSDVVFKNRWSCASSSDLMFLNSELLSDSSSNRFSSLEMDNNKQFTTTTTTTRSVGDDQIMKIREEMEIKRLFESKVSSTINSTTSASNSIPGTSTSRVMSPNDRRSVTEITVFSRFRNFSRIKNTSGESSSSGSNMKEERLRQLWLPIARRTAQWFANREKRSQQTADQQTADHSSRQTLHV